MFTANLSNLPDGVTPDMIDAHIGEPMTVDEFYQALKDFPHHLDYESSPDEIQDMYRSWCEDDHYPLSPVNKDDHEELWDNFLESLTKAKVAA